MQKVSVFIDLENTIIKTWNNHDLINILKIRNQLDSLQNFDRTIGIFSFAIYNETDKHIFNRDIKKKIEEALNVKIKVFPSIEDILFIIMKGTGCIWNSDSDEDVYEFFNLKGKSGAFEDFCISQGKTEEHFILIDDMVPDKIIEFKRTGLKIEFINVDTLD